MAIGRAEMLQTPSGTFAVYFFTATIRQHILCKIYLAIFYVLHLYLLTLVRYRMILIVMTRTGSLENETTNLQMHPLNIHLGRATIAEGVSKQSS